MQLDKSVYCTHTDEVTEDVMVKVAEREEKDWPQTEDHKVFV